MSQTHSPYWVVTATLFILFLLSNPIQAAVIYEFDDINHIVNATDSETDEQWQWLSWDQTLNLSVEDFLTGNNNSLLAEGWTIATNTQMAELFNDWFTTTNWDNDPDTAQLSDMGINIGSTDDATSVFIASFGDTFNLAGVTPIGTDDILQRTRAIFGGETTGFYNLAKVQDEWNSDMFGADQRSLAEMTIDNIRANESRADAGLALVRLAPEEAAEPVPEPQTLLLMSLAMIALTFKRILP